MATKYIFVTGGVVSGLGTVSYTHLDVYKRQLLECLTEAGSRLHAELGVASADGRHHYLTEAQQISEAILHLSLIHI